MSIIKINKHSIGEKSISHFNKFKVSYFDSYRFEINHELTHGYIFDKFGFNNWIIFKDDESWCCALNSIAQNITLKILIKYIACMLIQTVYDLIDLFIAFSISIPSLIIWALIFNIPITIQMFVYISISIYPFYLSLQPFKDFIVNILWILEDLRKQLKRGEKL